MIKVTRPEPPAFLFQRAMQKEQERMADFFRKADLQKRYNFHMSLLRRFRPSLVKVFNYRCGYCDRRIEVTDLAEVEQFRPKSVYWWLAYEWENQLLSCEVCSKRFKGVLFPVEQAQPQGSLTNKSSAELNELEKPLLLNPFTDDPEEHFAYAVDDDMKRVGMVARTKRGEVTIETVGLNRMELMNERYEIASLFIVMLTACKDTNIGRLETQKLVSRITEMTYDAAPFAGMTRWLLDDFERKHGVIALPGKAVKTERVIQRVERGVIEIPEISFPTRSIPLPIAASSNGLIINRFVPCEIEISNFKSISHLHLSFRGIEENMEYARQRLKPGEDIDRKLRESWLLLLGENGVGKSSVLQAIGLALLPGSLRDDYIEDPKALVKAGQQKGFVKIKLGDKEPVEMHFTRDGKVWGNVDQYNDYLLAYGATRLLPKGNLQPQPNTGRIKVHNLFDYSIALENAEQWLLGLNADDFDQAALFLKDLLFLKENLLRKDNKIYTQENGKQLELGVLSDGHKTLLALAVDMLKTFATQEGDARYRDIQRYASGIVLIDEIGTHLHPRWKMKIAERLRTALPRVFFIVTSHEPLCLRGLRDKEVVVLNREPGTGEISMVTDLPSPDGMRIDQLLTSRYFGLNSTIDPDIEEKFERYYLLLGKPEMDRTAQEKQEIELLQAELKSLNQLGETLREELFYYVIDEVIAQQVKKSGMKTKEALKDEVKTRIEALLKEIDINYL